MRRGLKGEAGGVPSASQADSSIFPDEEGTERRERREDARAVAVTAASSPMRRGLKGLRPGLGGDRATDSSIFPDEEGTERPTGARVSSVGG